MAKIFGSGAKEVSVNTSSFDAYKLLKPRGRPAVDQFPGLKPLNFLSFEKLVSWVKKHYKDSLKPNDLAGPQLLQESQTALDELSQLLNLGSIYPFQ